MSRAWTSAAPRELEEVAACSAVLVASGAALVVLSVAAFFMPRALVVPVLILGFAGISAAAGAAVARRTAAPPLALGVFCIAPGAVMALLVMVGVVGVGLLWLVLLAGAACGVALAVRRARRGAPGSGGGLRCPACEYDLGGIESIAGIVGCPECGFGRAAGAEAPLPATGRVWRMSAPSRSAADGGGGPG